MLHPNAKDLTGQKFGRLTAIKPMGRRGTYIAWFCQCDCGGKTIVSSGHLRTGHTKSCGCLHTLHNESQTNLYALWRGMIKRCTYPKSPNYKYYGERGIKVCSEWEADYLIFKEWALKNGYKAGLSIDRIDNNKGYCPDNCRWTTFKEQGANKRNNILWTYNGETKHAAEWARLLGISRTALVQRVNVLHWNIEKALTTPPQKAKKDGC